MTGSVSVNSSVRWWILGLAVLALGDTALAAGLPSTVTTTTSTISPPAGPDFDAVGYVPLDCQAKGDVAGDASPAAGDLVGDATRPATYVAHDAAYLYFRFRVSGNPTGDRGFAPYSWVVLLQVPSGNPFRHQFQLSLNGAGTSDDFGNSGVQQGDTIEIWKNDSAQTVAFGPLYDDPAESRLFAQRHDYIGPDTVNTLPLARIVPSADGSDFGGDPDYFVEFAVPVSVLIGKGVISGLADLDGTLYFPATSVDPNRFNKDALDCRFALATNLALTTTVVPAEVPAGGSAKVSFTIFARNNGATSAKGVVIRDGAFSGYLANFGLVVSSDDPSVAWTIVATNPLEIDVPTLPPGKYVRVVVGADARPSCSDVASNNTAVASAINAEAAVATAHLGIGPAGTEVCDGRDNDCNGLIDGVAGLCDDGCVCTSDSCDPVQGCLHTPIAFPCMSGDVCTPLGPSGGPISGGTLAVSMDANKDVTVVFTQSVDVNDNSYGTNIVKWPRSHVFNDLLGSDKAQFVFRNAAGTVVFDFNLDYISAKSGTPSGYASLGAASGDGHVNSGQAAWLLDWQTSLAENLNASGYCSGGNCTVSGVNLLANSPPTIPLNNGYGLSSEFDKWKFPIEYRVKVSHLAFGASGFGSVFVPTVHNSPPKIGSNTTTLGNCPTGACGCFGGCDDGNPCTTDSCASGQCQHALLSCDDGDPCTTDACANGQCQHPPVTCDDGNPCTTDSCDASSGLCSNVLHTGACSDGNACTIGDTCATGACVGTTQPDGASCDDGTMCDGHEICLGGACLPGIPLGCDDGCFSTQDLCDPLTGCFHTGPCDPIGACTVPYPFVSGNALTSVTFNESEVLRGFTATVGGECMPDQIRLWYNDEHALTLGVRRVVVKTAGGTSTTDYPISPLLSNPGAVFDPQVGATATGGDQAGIDTSGRPMFPALYVTDITADPTSLAGDWQFGGTPILPHAVFGSWKAAVRTVDKTVSPVLVTVTPDADPAKNDWSLGAGDTPPAGLANEGFGSEARWDASRLGLIAGHRYRFYLMVHDGDQNKVGGDSGHGCAQVRTERRCDQPCVTAADCVDQDTCNGAETCVNGTCRTGTPLNCDDGNPCTADSCVPATGCKHVANTLSCNDGNACTIADTCANGVCVGGATLNCNDSNACTDDSCSPATGCINANNTKPCSDGNACTMGDACGGGTCHAGLGALGCNDNNPCTDDSCTPATGCANANNQLPCSDGNACTLGDTCEGGICRAGVGRLACNDANPCTDDSCAPATGCVNANNQTPCSDGDACTVGDTCGGGSCHAGLAALGCNDDNPCTDDSCAPATGCVNANNTGPCSDGNACTVGDTCGDGSCHAGVGSLGCDDDNPCTDDSCAPASGCVNAANANPCDDSNACTVGDACGGGACRAGPSALDCNDANPCTDDSCAPATGCANVNNTTPCNDGDACTVGDTCADGVCQVGLGALACNDSNPCTDDSCVPATGCVNAPNANPCDDSNACTVGDTCGGGSCHAGLGALGCNDSNPCTDDSCVPATGCVNANNQTPCSDGDACTVGDTCGGGSCHAGLSALGCNDDNPCTDDSCAPATGCVNANNTRSCTDGNACTVGDTCAGGTCRTGTGALACNDNNPCTDDSCAPTTGCVNANNTNSCNDGNACTVGDTCGGGICQAGVSALDCNDHNVCTDDSCAPATGCVNVNNTATCNDGSACTLGDICGGGTCHAGVGSLACNDSNPCTDDSCAPATGCVNANNTRPCNDGNACTVGDTCGDGTCHAGPGALSCNDHNLCTDDSCAPATGCVNANNTMPCSDGNACTEGDVCGGGVCRAGLGALACNDNNPCTDDSCAPATGCVHANNTRPCTDGNVCTVLDVCGNGQCVAGGPLNCDDMNPCTDEHCDAVSGCSHVDNAASCSDDNSCSTLDTCANGTCVGGPPVDCSDGNACTNDACNPLSGAKTQGFYKRLCQGEHPEDAIDLASVACVNDSVTFRSVTTVAGLCDRLNPDPENDKCEQAEAQFMALLLNRCKLRVGNNQTVSSNCGGEQTVGQAIAHSDALLSAPTRSVDDCTIAQCEDEAINSSDESHTGVVNGPACVHTDAIGPCEDGSACTVGDTCAEGACVGGAAPNCNDNNPCTDDSCSTATGCVHANNTKTCSDGNACTTVDTCANGACVGSVAPNCNDNNPCTDDSCDPVLGCRHLNNSVACNDGFACTSGDACRNGTCNGDASTPDCTEPKPVDYYGGLCAGTHPEAELNPTVLACVAQWSRFQSVLTVSDACGILKPAPGSNECVRAEAELMAALLNLCTGRLAADEPIRSSCTDHTTAGQSLADANQLLTKASRSLGDCARARCETGELNSGKAVGTGYLMANRTSQGVRLDWSVPPLQSAWRTPSGFTVWRRPRGTGSFGAIAVVTEPHFDDLLGSAGINYEYQVTIMWP